MTYESIRHLHVACAVATAALLVVRLALAARGVDYRTLGPMRWIPHVVDTVLLSAAVVLVWWSSQYPFVAPWLTAKVLILPVYIIAAAVALDTSRPGRTRVFAGALACLLLASIFGIARLRTPWPFQI